MNPVHILLVEDNEGDIMLITEAFEDNNFPARMSVARNGQEAINRLHAEGEDLPDMVILDVNLPKINGHEVLAHIKADDALSHIPVIMLSTSSTESDIKKAYSGYACCYITKPVEIDDFFGLVATIEHFWVKVAQLPHTPP